MRKSVFVLLAMALVPAMTFATDGQVLINQATLIAAGGTYTITSPGSYKLSGNLQAKDLNTDVIVIAADHVTIDLNGFSILGTNDCSWGFSACVEAGTGDGITTTTSNQLMDLGPVHFNITIRNGTIQGMGNFGIFLHGDSQLVENMHIRSNGNSGIEIIASGDLEGSIVQNNTVDRNAVIGISISVGLVTHNTVTKNGLFGLSLGGVAVYIGNVISGNFAEVSGGHNLGQNLCGLAVCPSAQF